MNEYFREPVARIVMLKGEKGENIGAVWGNITGDISEQKDLAEKISDTLEEAKNYANYTTDRWEANVTLTASRWSNGEYTISNSNVTADSVIFVYPSKSITADQLKAFGHAKIVGVSQGTVSFKVKAIGTVPTVDIPVTVMIMR